MNLTAFSISLSVEDIEKSLEFYKNLGFRVVDGGHKNESFKDTDEQKWRILTNDIANIGLFEGMFNDNILSFNTKDIDKLKEEFNKKDIDILSDAKNSKTMLAIDPDGNKIMFDQVE